jgi:hypothetical protein
LKTGVRTPDIPGGGARRTLPGRSGNQQLYHQENRTLDNALPTSITAIFLFPAGTQIKDYNK